MGMYVCLNCQEEHDLHEDFGATHHAPCELCGHLKDDWTEKFVIFTQDLNRPLRAKEARPYIEAQLERRKLDAHIKI